MAEIIMCEVSSTFVPSEYDNKTYFINNYTNKENALYKSLLCFLHSAFDPLFMYKNFKNIFAMKPVL